LTGPYLDMRGWDLRYGGGEFVLLRNDDWIGPGHVTVVTDDAGVDWLIYHAIPPDNPRLPSGATRRPVLIDRIDWTGGWPVVNNEEAPSAGPQPAPVIV
jgi:arabinan endo-1,5-alpha-L-arabinosidase